MRTKLTSKQLRCLRRRRLALALVTADGFGVRGPVTAVEATTAGGVQDDLHGGRGEAGLMGM